MGVGRPRLDRRKPECQETELACEECIRRSASHIALLTPEATTGQLKLFFGLMYPTENCRPMLPTFLLASRCGAPPRRRPAAVETMSVAAVAAVA